MKKRTKIVMIVLGLVMLMGLSAFTIANQVGATNSAGNPPPELGGEPGKQLLALADELGVPLETLQAAHIEAATTLVQSKVEAGEITQDQADEIIEDLDDADHLLWRKAKKFRMDQGDEFDQYLADVLGISLDKLTVAKETVAMAALEQAVADGKLTQEQADLILARRAISGYMADAMTATRTNAINQALADGVITQAQAELLLSNLEKAPRQGSLSGFHGHRP